MYDYQLDPAFIEDKLIDLENWSRWNNLRVDNIKERPNETLEDCGKVLDTLFKESIGIEEGVVIERVHRVKTDKNKNKVMDQEELFSEFYIIKTKLKWGFLPSPSIIRSFGRR